MSKSTHRQHCPQLEACSHCGFRPDPETGFGLEVHHVDRNRKNNDPANLLALCVPCHDQFHKQAQSPRLVRPDMPELGKRIDASVMAKYPHKAKGKRQLPGIRNQPRVCVSVRIPNALFETVQRFAWEEGWMMAAECQAALDYWREAPPEVREAVREARRAAMREGEAG